MCPSLVSLSQPVKKKNISAMTAKSKKGSGEGKLYEISSLLMLSKRGYELSKCDNSKFCDFAIGREVGIGKDGKFDDIVFSYTDQDNTNNLIFVQIKHKQDDSLQIHSKALSAEASKAKGGGNGGLPRDFNLQKYFISYLDIKEELRNPERAKYRNGKIKYIAIFTNIGLNTGELNENGFSLKKAPEDIINLFTSKESEECNHCYQLGSVSEDLHKILMRSSDLQTLGRELAKYVVWGNYRENNILGIDETPIKHYHAVLEREVIKKSVEIKFKSSEEPNTKDKEYCDAYFRDDFIDGNESGSKQELRDALFEAVRVLDESKKSVNEDELKELLKNIENWKVVPNFGKTKKKNKICLPNTWITVKENDIAEFLKCLVFITNQPKVKELEGIFRSSVRDIIVENTSLKQLLDKIQNTGPELKKCIEKALGIYKKTKYEEKWISGENIVNFIEEQIRLISISFRITAMTQMYEDSVMRLGKFRKAGKLEESLDRFLLSNSKVLRIYTSTTLFSYIKIVQYLNTTINCSAEDGRISVLNDILSCKENRDSVLKAFQLDNNNLLIIECRYIYRQQDVEELCRIAQNNKNKKIIFIIQQDEHKFEECRTDYMNEAEDDFIDVKNFEPQEDPFKKEMIIFQGQETAVSLATLTGINSWNFYIDYLSQEPFHERQNLIEPKVLAEILDKDEIVVGSKVLGTSNLDGAYAIMFEEINVDTLVNKLLSCNPVNQSDDIYIMSGMSGLNKTEKINKFIQYLGLANYHEKIKNQFGYIGSNSRIQIADDEFKDNDFKQLCSDYPEKMVFWIFIKCEESGSKFILQQLYNPKFYIKRTFRNVVINKKVKEHLMNKYLYEIFIFFPVNNILEFADSFQFENMYEKEKIENNCRNGKIKLFNLEDSARSAFKKICKQFQNVYLIRIEKKQFIWCNSLVYHGDLSLDPLKKYIDQEQSKISLVEEDNLIKEIKDKKVVIISDDPGMGKTTSLTKLYEAKDQTMSFFETHWVLRINLKDQLEALRDIEFKNNRLDILNVVNFLSKVDLKLNHNLAKYLMRVSLLDLNNKIPKPMLLAFDGFDEVLDEVDRGKIISLLKFLNHETAAKVWITTRLHYKDILETELSTFAIEFDPLNDDSKEEYIKKYLKDRMCLILSEKEFAEVFIQRDRMQDNECIKVYISKFLNNMKSVFKSNTFNFIGTPLQLYLMLEGSVSHFKKWIKNCDGQNLNFDYLGNDILDVYKKFLGRKYDVYFRKMGIKEGVRQTQDKFIFNQYNTYFAKSLILKTKYLKFLEKFKHIVLSAGIIKSNGTNVEFIHITFRDYFAAKVFVQWIKKAPNTLPHLNKHKFLLQKIFQKSDYQQIRTFIDLRLKKMAQTESFTEIGNHYGMIVEQLFREEESCLVDEKGTSLHCAVEEANRNIVFFLLNSFKGHTDVLRKFLFHRVVYEKSALDLVFHRNDIEILKHLLDAAEGNSKDILQELLHFSNVHGQNILDTAAIFCKKFKLFRELMNRADNKLDLIMNENKENSSLNIALGYGNGDFVGFLIQEFKRDENSLKQLLLFNDKRFSNALGVALHRRDYCSVEYLLCIAKKMSDNETLKKMLLPDNYPGPLRFAIFSRKTHFVKMLLRAAEDINEDTLKQVLLEDAKQESVFLDAAKTDHSNIIKLLLGTAKRLGENVLQTFAFSVNADGENALHLMLKFRYTQISADNIKLLLETAASLGQEVLENFFFAENKDGKHAIHLIVEVGRADIIESLFKTPEEVKYHSIRDKVIELYNKISEEHELNIYKQRLIVSAKRSLINDVKSILESVKNLKINRSQKLRDLLLVVEKEQQRRNALHIACEEGNLRIIKELLSCAISINDGGTTLMHLITSQSAFNKTPFEMLKFGYNSEIKQILDILISEAETNKNGYSVKILQEINDNYGEKNSSLETYASLFCNNWP